MDFELHAAGSPDIPGGGFTEVVNAMGAWNALTGTGINFASAGTTSDIVSARTDDGKNQMLFEDPFDDISGSFDASGGTAAIITWSFDCNTSHFIPDGGTTVSVAWLETDIVTQDGFGSTLASELASPGEMFEKIVGHELGHSLGIGHSCTTTEVQDNTCPSPQDRSLMRAHLTADGQGAVLNSDDIAAAQTLYPAGKTFEPPPPGPGGGGGGPPPQTEPEPEPEPPPPPPCLLDSRFQVRTEYWSAGEEPVLATLVRAGTNESGMFRFFGPGNWELLIKVLDGCEANGHVWVFGGATTDLGYRITVTDTVDGAVRVYTNEPGNPASAIADAKAFGCSGPGSAAVTR